MALEDSIFVRPPPQDLIAKGSGQHVLVYFITGNPGLIEYYREFLTDLSTLLHSKTKETMYHVIGPSLGGFELQRGVDARQKHPPYNLRDQIIIVEKEITRNAIEAQKLRRRGSDDFNRISTQPLPVILVGHSVGAYILLELIGRRQTMQMACVGSRVEATSEINGGICLFPTVVDIAKSPNGKKLSSFALLPGFALIIHTVARLLCLILPAFVLVFLIRKITGQTRKAARITAAFLRSRNGVKQALYLGRDELQEMTDDKWPAEVWAGPISPNPSTNTAPATRAKIDRPKLYFYWGENDHWIDKSTRDVVIASRGRTDELGQEGKPQMEVDTNGVPHDFCISGHSKLVAQKVATYVEEIMDSRS